MTRTAQPPRSPRPTRPSRPPQPARPRHAPSVLALADAHRRGTILLVATGLVLTLFGGRLIELQAVKGEALASAALDQRLRTQTLPANRGTILADGGEALAVTAEARNVTADQTLVTDPAAVAAQLGPILGAAPAVLEARLTGDRRFIYVAKGLTPETWDRIDALRLPGIFSEPTSRRVVSEEASKQVVEMMESAITMDRELVLDFMFATAATTTFPVQKRVVYEPVKLAQDFRSFDFMSPWEGADYVLPGDKKAAKEAEGGEAK